MKSALRLVICLFIGVLNAQAQVAKTVVVEHFTNTKCPICKNRNPGFYTNLNNQSGILHLAVHPSSPYVSCLLSQQAQPDNDDRTKYYGVYGSTPRLVIQGTPISASADYNSSALFAPFINQTTPIEIKIEQTKYGADSIYAKIIIKAAAANNLGSLKLFVALAEDTIFYTGSNGEKEHYDVLRKSLFGATGKTVTIPASLGDTVVYEVSASANPIWDFSRIYIMTILQDASTKEVVQSYASSPDENGVITNTFSPKELLAKIYPNPATTVINIELEHNLAYSASLYSMDGKVVLQKSLNGNSVIDINHFAKGTYILELISEDAKTVKKIQIK